MLILQFYGMISGRKDNDKGHIAEMIKQGTSFCTIGPPEDKEYAVDPFGVEIINPSIM